MAIDTQVKRRSVHAYSGGDAALVAPPAIGAIGRPERAHVTGVYWGLFTNPLDLGMVFVQGSLAAVQVTTLTPAGLGIGVISQTVALPAGLAIGLIADGLRTVPLGIAYPVAIPTSVPLAIGAMDY